MESNIRLTAAAKWTSRILGGGCGIALMLAAASAGAQSLKPVRLAMDWTTWVTYHAPILIAQNDGYFKAEGLDVTTASSILLRMSASNSMARASLA